MSKQAVEPKMFRDYICNCRKKCNEKISIEQRKDCFNKFWNTGDYNIQTSLLCNMVQQREVSRHRGNDNSKRSYSRVYIFNETEVCRDFFCQTLRISMKRVNTALEKHRSGLSFLDQRKNNGGHNKITDRQTQDVMEHIGKFPKYVSHYNRNNTNLKYLPPDLTVSKMYDLYKKEYDNIVSFSKYKDIFLRNFNLRRKRIKKDTCNICDKLNAEIQSTNNEVGREQLKADHRIHVDKAEEAQKLLKQDMITSTIDEEMETITFDLEKTLPLPRIPTNIIFCKWQLWLYNCGIHTGKNNEPHCVD